MTKKKSTKRALLLSALSLLLCVSMLVGSTYAWFTDEVTSAGNIIKSGNLDVTMDWFDGTKAVPAVDSEDWIDASAGPIFNYELWEPGYTVVRHVKIENVGSLALKYTLNIQANGKVTELADVIDVYFVDPAVQVADRAALADQFKVGTLSDILAGMPANASGKLLAGENATVTLALKMQETAGNEYKNLEIGTDFSVVLLATQLTYEEDSFDKEYDKAAAWLGNADTTWYNETETEFALDTAEEFAGLAALVNEGNSFEGKTISLAKDLDLNGVEWTPIGETEDAPFKGTFDGNGKTIANLNVGDANTTDAALINYAEGATIANIIFENVDVDGRYAATVVNTAENSTIENIQVLSGSVDASAYAAGVAAITDGTTIKNCVNGAEVNSPFSASGIGAWILNATVENCENNADVTGGNRAAGIVGNISGTVQGCTNNGDVTVSGVATAGMPAGGIAAVLSGATTFENCTNNGDVTNMHTDIYNASAAGILGHTPGSAAKIISCTNNGKITSAYCVAAGIGVSMYGGITATDCVNTGDITGARGAEGTVAAKGMFSSTNTVTNCTNSGVVTVG